MRVLLFCAAVVIPSFTWTQGLGNGWVVKKNVAAAENGLAILAVAIPASQIRVPPGVGEGETFEFVQGVVRDFNKNGVADSEQRYSFPVRQTIFVLLPPIESSNPHVLRGMNGNAGPHRVILEFQDEFGCIYCPPEDMQHDPDGKLGIDLIPG